MIVMGLQIVLIVSVHLIQCVHRLNVLMEQQYGMENHVLRVCVEMERHKVQKSVMMGILLMEIDADETVER